jgi:hypothetical protein
LRPVKRLLAVLLFLSLFVPLTAHAWTRASDERIAEKGAMLAPPDLRIVLTHYDPSYKTGIARAQSEEGNETHHYFVLSRSGKLRERIEAETAKTIAMLRKHESMAQVVERLGTLAHLVADANNPFHVSHDDPRLDPAHDDFEQYFERRMATFPTVFYGLDDQPNVTAIVERAVTRTEHFYPLVSSEYFPASGDPRSSADFDDHSTAFGVASVCYSHAVTDLVNLYYYIWREAGGDVRSASVMHGSNLILNATPSN